MPTPYYRNRDLLLKCRPCNPRRSTTIFYVKKDSEYTYMEALIAAQNKTHRGLIINKQTFWSVQNHFEIFILFILFFCMFDLLLYVTKNLF